MYSGKNREKMKKPKIKFKVLDTPLEYIEMLEKMLTDIYEADLYDYVSEKLKMLCFNDVCIIYEPIGIEPAKITIYCGPWIAIMNRGKIAPSIPLINEIFRKKGVRGAIEVCERGIKAFLYGNDILIESIVTKYPPCDRLVAVIDHVDKEIVGFAEWDKENNVYRNIYDIGIFLRQIG